MHQVERKGEVTEPLQESICREFGICQDDKSGRKHRKDRAHPRSGLVASNKNDTENNSAPTYAGNEILFRALYRLLGHGQTSAYQKFPRT